MKELFLQSIYTLREEGKFELFVESPSISAEEKKRMIEYLEIELEEESQNYPFQCPVFNADAAFWAAQFLYYLAAFAVVPNAENKKSVEKLASYNGVVNASAIVSADLTLRFVPDVLKLLLHSTVTGEPAELAERLSTMWIPFHYSFIGYLDLTQFQKIENFDILNSDTCLKQLYLDRIVRKNATLFQEHSYFQKAFSEQFGTYAKDFWPSFNQAEQI